jgi:hypothetical protein
LPSNSTSPDAGRQESGDHPRDGGLARPDSPTTATVRPGGHVEAHVLQDRGLAVARRHAPDRDDGRARGGGPFRPGEAAHGPERFRVVLARLAEHLARGRLLHLLAAQEHLDAVGHLRDHGKVVGDVDRGGAELLHDVADRGQHLDLGGDVERGGGFVEDDEVGAAGHGHRRHRPLKLPARDLVRIAEADLLGVGQLHPAVEVDGVGVRPVAGHDTVDDGRLAILVDELVGGVEARRRGLRDIGDAAAAQAAAFGLGRGAQVDPVEEDRAPRDPAAVAGIAHGGKADGGLARTGFADQPQHLAPVQRQAHALHDLRPVVARPALDPQVRDGEKRVHGLTPSAPRRGAAASPRRSSPPR